MKKKILIISGGISKERAISLDTGRQVAKELAKNGYVVKITEPDFKLLDVIKVFKPKAIFNLAAETHVDRSIDGPKKFIQTNINGTFNLLESLRILKKNLGLESRQ